MTLELTHEMGIIYDPNVQWFRDPNHYLRDAGKADTVNPGELWTYTGPDVNVRACRVCPDNWASTSWA